MMIEKLTKEQEKMMKEYVKQGLDIGLKTSESIDENKLTDCVNNFYKKIMKQNPPEEIVIKRSPIECWQYIEEQVGQKMNFVWPYISGQFDSYIFAFYDYFINELNIKIESKDKPKENLIDLYNTWKSIIDFGIQYIFDDVCIVSMNPVEIHKNESGLHCETGPAIRFSDGYELYYLNGVNVKKEYVMTPWNKIDCKSLLKETNAEVRRELVRKIGIERICSELNCKIADKHTVIINGQETPYELILLDIGDNNLRPYLKMINPSIGTYHIEGVHPDCKTVKDALEWRNGTKEIPEILT